MFRKNVPSPSSGSQSKPSKQLPGLLFEPEDDSDTLLRNVGGLVPDYTVSQILPIGSPV
jgi:hypothetical protein